MGIFKIGFKDLRRNKTKSIISISGIIISIIIISGINISTQSLTTYNINQSLSSTYVDMKIYSDSTEIDEILSTLTEVKKYDDDLVSDIIPAYSQFYEDKLIITTNQTINWTKVDLGEVHYEEYASINGIGSSFFSLERFDEIYKIVSGKAPKNDGEIIIDYSSFLRLGIDINDNLTVGYKLSKGITIPNLKVVGTFKIDYTYGFFLLFNEFNEYFHEDNIILSNFQTALDIHTNFSDPKDYSTYSDIGLYSSYNLLLDHHSINIFDLEEAIDDIRRIETRIYIEDEDNFDFKVYNRIYWRLRSLKEFMIYYQLLLLAVSIPVYILGLYLSTTLFNLSLDKQENRISQYLSKGATKKQIKIWIISESLIFAIIGGIFGFLCGIVFSYILIQQLLQENFSMFLTTIGLIYTPFTFIFSIMVACIFCLIALLKPLKALSRKPIRVASNKFNYISHDDDKKKKIRKYWLLVIMGLLPLIFTIFITREIILEMPWEMQIVLFNLTEFIIGWTIASTFLLTYGFLKLLSTKYSNQFINISQKIINQFSELNSKLISNNFRKNLEKSIALFFMVSFCFSFLIMTNIVSASQEEYEKEVTYLRVGADLKADCYSYFYDENLKESIEKSSSSINDVASILNFDSYDSYLISQNEDLSQISLFAVDPDDYLSICNLKDKYFSNGDDQEIILDLKNIKNGVILNKQWADDLGVIKGDKIKLDINTIIYGMQYEMQFEVIGFYNVLPGLSIYTFSILNLLINIDYINSNFNINNFSYFRFSYLIDIVDGKDSGKVADNLEREFDDSIASILILEEEMDNIGNAESYTSVVYLLDLENYFILIITAFGLLILIYDNLSQREIETAVLRARGFSKKGIMKLNISEGLLLIFFGALFGLIGFFTAYVMNVQLDNRIFEYLPLTRDYIIPISLLWQLMLTFTILISIIIIVSYKEAKKTSIKQLSKLLKV